MRTRMQVMAALVASAVYVAVLRLPDLTVYVGDFVSNVGQVLAVAFAAAACWRASRRSTGRHRKAWAWLAGGMGSWFAGQCIWTWYELLGRSIPYPSLADLGFLGFPLASGVGLVLWLGTQGGQLVARSRDVMAGAIISLSLFVLSWVTVLGTVVDAGTEDGLFGFLLSLAYPVGDLILATLALVALTRSTAGERTALIILCVGLTVFAVADSAFVYLSSTSTFSSTDLVSNGGWFAGFLLMGVAGLAARHDGASAESEAEASLPRPGRLRISVTYVPLVIAGSVIVHDLLQVGVPRVELLLGVALVGLVLAHQLLAMTENQRLLSALAEARDQLEHQALHDALTGLPNRVLFADRLDRALLQPGSDVCVLFCDLDNFKQVNDTLGHEAGDTLLTLVAERLVDCVRVTDTVARLGGDEFAILLQDSADPEGVAERVVASMQQHTEVAGHEVHTSISVGIAHQASRAPDVDHDRRLDATAAVPIADLTCAAERESRAALLLRHADIAMYAAKGAGKNRASTPVEV